TLGHHRLDAHSAENGADRTLVHHLAVDEERLRLRLARPGGQPADQRNLALDLGELREEARGRERERVDEQRDEVGIFERRDAADSDAVVELEGAGLKSLDPAPGKRAGPARSAGPVPEPPAAADPALGTATQEP